MRLLVRVTIDFLLREHLRSPMIMQQTAAVDDVEGFVNVASWACNLFYGASGLPYNVLLLLLLLLIF